MKIRSITIQGFRGFNEERTIDFNERLTLVYAPNSYGKTSISEALEWLLYGVTSKVEEADYSKDEYKGSCWNRHLPESLTPFVQAPFVQDGSEIEFRGELTEDDGIKRFVNGSEVRSWPLAQNLSMAPRPFILQHVLKYLLLVKPDARFQGFARLLGLEELEQIQRNFISLCTAPEHSIPGEVDQFLTDINALEARLASQPSLVAIQKAFKKEQAGLAETYRVINDECRQRVPPSTTEKSILPQLLKIREDAISKIFRGRIILSNYSDEEKQANTQDDNFFLTFGGNGFVKKYTGLAALATIQHVLDRAEFLGLGIKFLDSAPGKCPFCGQLLDEALSQHIHQEHETFARERVRNRALENQRSEVIDSLAKLRRHLDICRARHKNKVAPFLELKPSLSQLKTILVPKHETHFRATETAILQLETVTGKLEAAHKKAIEALAKVEASVSKSKEDTNLVKGLGEALVEYIAESHSYTQAVSENVSGMSDADQILKHELDALAETEDIAVLIDLLERQSDIEKKFKIQAILESLKDLRKAVNQYVGNKILQAISVELTSEVMKWYKLIRTTGDPDVHFDGFDIERTKTGELKARRVQIKAKSYGKDLVSAVSSLSESKLNALGLCVSIATNLKGESLFDFLLIDDPIQSWDAEHEIQFIEVIKKLIERGKQVILLSHNRGWIDQVRSGCRTLNGSFYEITGYTQAGPHLRLVAWEKWEERLSEVDAILKDPNATSVRLQQAEGEIRIVVGELTSELYFKKKGIRKDASKLNSSKVRKALVECSVKEELVNRITQTFETTDDAHHTPVDYTAQRERIRRYHSWAHELAKLLDIPTPPPPSFGVRRVWGGLSGG